MNATDSLGHAPDIRKSRQRYRNADGSAYEKNFYFL